MKKTIILFSVIILAVAGGLIFLANAPIPAPTAEVEKTLDAAEYIN